MDEVACIDRVFTYYLLINPRITLELPGLYGEVKWC